MAIISGATIITSLSLFHITLAFFFLTSPSSIVDQQIVFILGEAMGLPYSPSFENKSPALSFAAAGLFILGITDLVSASLPEEISQYHWGSQAPIRLLLFGTLTFYTFAFSPKGPLSPEFYTPSSWGEGLKNRIVFTWAFLEMITWFWAFLTLREERQLLAERIRARRAAEEDMMMR
ncbi:increased loss of mitochondrial DNA protein 1 [Bisporella sp. PMI_857]|nr:increased loss of mitochondrial DNA protein 1 [Bisporella sp. PMI_857]